MEPGHEDREYFGGVLPGFSGVVASMEPGHEDREYSATSASQSTWQKPQWSPVMKTGNTYLRMFWSQCTPCLNGARS